MQQRTLEERIAGPQESRCNACMSEPECRHYICHVCLDVVTMDQCLMDFRCQHVIHAACTYGRSDQTITCGVCAANVPFDVYDNGVLVLRGPAQGSRVAEVPVPASVSTPGAAHLTWEMRANLARRQYEQATDTLSQFYRANGIRTQNRRPERMPMPNQRPVAAPSAPAPPRGPRIVPVTEVGSDSGHGVLQEAATVVIENARLGVNVAHIASRDVQLRRAEMWAEHTRRIAQSLLGIAEDILDAVEDRRQQSPPNTFGAHAPAGSITDATRPLIEQNLQDLRDLTRRMEDQLVLPPASNRNASGASEDA